MTMIKENLNDAEIRKLPASVILKLSQILETNEGWKKLMGVVPVNCNEENPLKYSAGDMKTIENERTQCAAIFLEEWGTSGKCRPTVSFLLKCLTNAKLYRAADYVALEVLKTETGPTRPAEGPAAPVLWSIETCVPSAPSAPPYSDSVAHGEVATCPYSTRLAGSLSDEVAKISYSTVLSATAGFSNKRVLGEGAFGRVYQASIAGVGKVAIKRIHNNGIVGDPVSQFYNEVKVLTQLKHPNLLPLLGYSTDGPALCLAYQFMRNGSLLDQLNPQKTQENLKKKTNPLEWRTRVEISVGTARGLCHLHTALQQPLVHRDVKSANILLDDNLTPKLGDFGLVRLGSQGLHSYTVAVTSTVVGTNMYMAPEALRGDVSTKMDVFSFGVVLLELLTGLPPYDEKRSDHDLITYVEGFNNIEDLLDFRAGNWSQEISAGMFKVAKYCLENKKKRPDSSTLVLELERFLS